jgi:hypothetical protein
MRNHAGQREAKRRARLERLLDEREHGVLVEAPALQVGVLEKRDLELASSLSRFDVDAGLAQLLQMVLAVLRGRHVKGTLTAIEPAANERQQRVVLLLR